MVDYGAFGNILAGFRQSRADQIPAATLVWKTYSYPATRTAFEQTEAPRSMPDGSSNAANADTCAWSLSPSLCTGGLPQVNDTVTWLGQDYTVVRSDMNPTGATWRILAYHVPVNGTSADDADQEAMFEYTDPTG